MKINKKYLHKSLTPQPLLAFIHPFSFSLSVWSNKTSCCSYESRSRKPLAIVSIHNTVYLSPPEQCRASTLQRARRGWEPTFHAVCEDRNNASRKQDTQLAGALLRLFILCSLVCILSTLVLLISTNHETSSERKRDGSGERGRCKQCVLQVIDHPVLIYRSHPGLFMEPNGGIYGLSRTQHK